MEELYYISLDTGDYFSLEEKELVHKNLEGFRRSFNAYRDTEVKDLIAKFIKLGSEDLPLLIEKEKDLSKLSKKLIFWKIKENRKDLQNVETELLNTKLDYLAIYEILLNHEDLMLSIEDINDELSEKLAEVNKSDENEIIKLLDDVIAKFKKSSEFALKNAELVKRDNGEFLNKFLDFGSKWRLIGKRENANFEEMKGIIIESFNEQIENLKNQFGSDVEITFSGSGSSLLTLDEDSDVVEDEQVYVKEEPRDPKKPVDIVRDPSIL